MQVTKETLINQISHVLNRWLLWRISRPRKKLHALSLTEAWNSLYNIWVCIILLIDSFRDALKEGNDSGCSATMSFYNAFWKAMLTGIASSTNAVIMVLKNWSLVHLKRKLDAKQLIRLCAHEPIADADGGFPWRGFCIKAPLHSAKLQQTSTDWQSRH